MSDNIKDLIDDDDLAQTLVMRNRQLRILYGERAKWVKERRELRQALEKIRGLGRNDTVQDAVYIARNALKGTGE